MKTGCIFRVAAVAIVASGIGYHMYEKYGVPYIEEGKEEIAEIVRDRLKTEIDAIIEKAEQEALEKLFSEHLADSLQINTEFGLEKIEALTDAIRDKIKDQKLDQFELESIKKILERYEKREEN